MVVLHHQTKTLKRFFKKKIFFFNFIYLFIYFLCRSDSGIDKTQILAY